MPKYFINGKSVFSEKPLGDDEIGELGKAENTNVDTKPQGQISDPTQNKSLPGQQAWQKASSIGAPGIGSHYIDSEAPKTLWDLVRKYTVGDERARSVANQDPFGTTAFRLGKGPMPMMIAAEGFNHIPINPAIENVLAKSKSPGRLALPPAPPEIANAKPPTFLAGPDGVIPADKPLSGNLARGAAQIETDRPGVPKEILTPSKALAIKEPPLTPSQAKNLPNQQGKVVDLTDDLTKDLHNKAVANQESIPGPVRNPHEPAYPQETSSIVEQPSAKVKLKSKPAPVEEKLIVLDNKGNVKTEPITPDLSPKEAVSRWANGRRGASVRADFIKQDFKDLSEPSLVDAFEHGDRSGRLADVAKYFDDRHAEGVSLGLLKEDQKVLNYLRHEFQQDPDKVTAASKSYFAKNPSIAKTREFPTYKAAESTGLTRKYNTLPEIMEAYEKKFGEAVRNKEMYDYLNQTGQISGKTMLNTRPDSWTFKGENAKELSKLVGNVFSQSPEGLKKAGDVASLTKNLYLGGGIPGTKYNMHTWNVTRSDIKLAGFKKATQELLSDPTGKYAEAVFAQHSDILPELVDHGYTYRPIEDSGANVNFGSKALDKYQSVFEKPLFEKSLPALKLKRTVQVLEDLQATGMDRKTALTKAAKIGNEFYGGINKELRNSTYNDLSRIVFLAPDWLESRVRVAVGDFKGAAKVILGKADAVDKIHAKSFGRGLATTGATLGSSAYLGGKLLSGKPNDSLTIPLGSDSQGKTRSLPTIGTADEAQRLPIDVALKAYHGNPGGLIEDLIKNKLSQPMKSATNIVRGQDDFGNSIRGKDKYGKDITMGRSLWLHIKEASAPIQPQLLQYMLKYASGGTSLEEAISGGFELPLKYSNPPNKTKLTLGSVGSVGSPY